MLERNPIRRQNAVVLIEHPVFKKFWSSITDDDYKHGAHGSNKEPPKWNNYKHVEPTK